MILKKSKDIHIAFLLIIMNLFFTCASSPKMKTIRPISIKVVDSETNLPLENVIVYYQLKSYVYIDKILFILPRPETRVVQKIEVLKQLYTNKDGELLIENISVKLKKNEEIYSEEITINMDIDIDKIKWSVDSTPKEIKERGKAENFFRYLNINDSRNTEYFYNPLEEFRGYFIFSVYGAVNPSNYGGTVRKNFDILWNGESLAKEKDKIIIKLKKH